MFFFFATSALSLLTTKAQEKSYLSWMRQNNQFFTGDEYHLRFGIFLANQRYVQEFNSNPKNKFRVGLNKFSCYTPSEYKALLGHIPMRSPQTQKEITKAVPKDLKLPDSVNWIEKGAVNPIRNQGNCGSCWAFAAIASLEAAYQIKNGKLLALSEQNLVDCVEYCVGCNGGNGFAAFEYVRDKQDRKIQLQADYPYTAVTGTCVFDGTKDCGTMKDYTFVIPHSEVDLKYRVADWGVVDSSIDASAQAFQLYTSGIYDDDSCSSFSRNHEVAVVGYGSENGTNYWLVKNSWGTEWGEEGYIRMLRGTITNLCGIASACYIPYC